jgi:hypothetical protein
MNGFVIVSLLYFYNPIISDSRDETVFALSNQKIPEFYGSIETNDDGLLVFHHVPTGPVKPAVLFINRMSFVKRSDKLKAFRNAGKNARIKAEFVDLNDMQILIVYSLEILELGQTNI